MKTDKATMKMKAKLDAFFATATEADISALLQRTNYEFYKNVEEPGSCEIDEPYFDFSAHNYIRHVAVSAFQATSRISNRPIIFIGRGHPAADHQDLALAA